MSDIHGYSIALERILEDIAKHEDIDRLIAAGDLCETGPDPAGAFDLLTDRGVELVMGNTDLDLVQQQEPSKTKQWSCDQLGKSRLAALSSLSPSIRVTPPGEVGEAQDLLVVHADPHSLDGGFHPDLDDLSARSVIGPTAAAAIAFGHVHIAYQRIVDRTLLVDVSAVGNPKDGDLRPRWAVLSWNTETMAWSAHHNYVDYPLRETRRQINSCGMPNPGRTFRRLVHASYLPMP